MNADYVASIAKSTKFAFIFAEVIGGGITGSAFLDCIFHLGWGYNWMAAFGSLGIMAWGVVVYLICRVVFKFVGRL